MIFLLESKVNSCRVWFFLGGWNILCPVREEVYGVYKWKLKLS